MLDSFHFGMDRLHREKLMCTRKKQKEIVHTKNTHSLRTMQQMAKGKLSDAQYVKWVLLRSHPP